MKKIGIASIPIFFDFLGKNWYRFDTLPLNKNIKNLKNLKTK
jgi:hypothetical protein